MPTTYRRLDEHTVAMTTTTFTHVDQIARANKALGNHWFSRDTMRFFDSKTYGSIHHGRYFISGEKYSDDHKRYYTIRLANEDGSVETIGDFQKYGTYKAAWAALDRMIEAGELTSYGPPVIDAR